MDPVEKLARYMREMAKKGSGMTGNTRSLAMFLGLTQSQVSDARHVLYRSGRLVAMGQQYASIDGIKFGGEGKEPPKTEAMMTILRRRFSPVCDARVIDRPNEAAAGTPREVVIGDVRLGLAHAFALAILSSPQSKVFA